MHCVAKKYTAKHGSAAARAAKEENSSDEDKGDKSEEESESEGEGEDEETWPLEVDPRNYKRGLTSQLLQLLHTMTTGLDVELNPKRIVLPAEFVSRTWAILKQGNEDVFDFQLTFAVDACMWYAEDEEADDYTIAASDVISCGLASLLHYARTGMLLQLEGDMAAYVKKDPSEHLGWRLKHGIIEDKALCAAMPEAAKHAKALVKLLDGEVGSGMVVREATAAGGGGCCIVS